MKTFLHAKIHRATVTEADINYIGSITIDQDLMDKTGIEKWEKVLVVSNTSGARLETYVIPAPKLSGTICMNGAAAHLIKKGEQVIIMAFESATKASEPKIILVDQYNHFLQYL